MSYSRWEGRKNAPLNFPSSSNPSMKAYGMEWQAERGRGTEEDGMDIGVFGLPALSICR